MDDVIKIIAIGFIATISIIIIKQYKSEFAIYISVITGIIIIYMIFNKLEGIINLLKTISNKSGINSEFLGLLLKITGIAILTEFGVTICKDAGGKVIIISMSIPIISSFLEVILKLV